MKGTASYAKLVSGQNVTKNVPIIHRLLLGTAAALLLLSFYLIFIWSPMEKTMGAVQKIFYIHVASASSAFLAFFVVFVCSLAFLITRKRFFDTYAAVSAEIGIVYTIIVLTSGPIWGRSAWNIWWNWEPRMTTMLTLLFVYLAYLMIRQMDGAWEKKARLSAVFGIIGFLDVPLVIFAIRWWQPSFHPIVFGEGPGQKGGGIEDPMMVTLLVTIAATTLLYSYLLLKGVSLENFRLKIHSHKEKLREKLDK